MKKKNLLYFAILFLVLAIFTFFYERYRIPNIVSSMQEIEKLGVFYAQEEIPKNTYLDDETMSKFIKQVEVPTDYVYAEPIDYEEMKGKKTISDIPSGTILSKDFFINEKDGFDDGIQLYSFPISLADTVIGEVQPNDYVTLWVRYPASANKYTLDKSDSEVVIPYLKIVDLTDEQGLSISAGGETVSYVVIKANRDMIQDIEVARNYNVFFTKYGENEELVPSKSFNRLEHLYTSKPFINYEEKQAYLDSLPDYSVESIDDTNISTDTLENEPVTDDGLIEGESTDTTTETPDEQGTTSTNDENGE